MVSMPLPRSCSLDLDNLELDPVPTFVIKIATYAIPFRILYCNKAFRTEALEHVVSASTSEALVFRSWALAIEFFKARNNFAGYVWDATTAGSRRDWKIVRMVGKCYDEMPYEGETSEPSISKLASEQEARTSSTEQKLWRMHRLPQATIKELPTANLHARWDSLQTMMDMSDVGVFEYLPNGKLIHANDAWYRLSGYPRDLPAHEYYAFMDLAYPEDRDNIMSAWNSLIQGNCVTFEMRWKARPGSGDDAQWVLSACVPVLDEDRNLISIAGNTIDINAQKKFQEVQRRQIDEALEAKRQQENFIDMTSHELRNPLSAVVQCADSVISTLQQLTPKELLSMHLQIEKVQDEISYCIDNLQTIVSCSLHQKRIIDDVLTLSKLDSNLLLITPMRVQPALVVSEAMKMFDVECRNAQINLVFQEDESLAGFEWVMLDPSRLLQVLINLLTNAVKFTKDQEVRNITVTLGGSWTHESIDLGNVTFANDTPPQTNIFDKPNWGNGRLGYIWLRVDDTGCGIAEDEQKNLSSRFSQATPRTHIKYGGSGLGLFISKSLTALQGGSVGLKSEAGRGSTFAFYVGTRVAEGPRNTANNKKLQRPILSPTVSVEIAMKKAALNVLVVEDNLVNQVVLKKQLQKAGFNVSVAGNGAEAIEWLQNSLYWHGDPPENKLDKNGSLNAEISLVESFPRHEIDLLLMDIEMPVMDGLNCARQIRSYEARGLLAPPPLTPATQELAMTVHHEQRSTMHPGFARRRGHLPILAVSANARTEQVEEALSAGMDDAISKPFRIPELWPKIRALVPRCVSPPLS